MNKFLVKNPIISEKAHDLSGIGKYVFLVDKKANKSETKKVIEGVYKVNVIKLNVLNVKPKPKRFGKNISMKSGYKKVIITLKEGQKLDVMPH